MKRTPVCRRPKLMCSGSMRNCRNISRTSVSAPIVVLHCKIYSLPAFGILDDQRADDRADAFAVRGTRQKYVGASQSVGKEDGARVDFVQGIGMGCHQRATSARSIRWICGYDSRFDFAIILYTMFNNLLLRQVHTTETRDKPSNARHVAHIPYHQLSIYTRSADLRHISALRRI